MPNEQSYPTMRFMRCKKCGNVFVANTGMPQECPECSDTDAVPYTPGADETGEIPPAG